MKRKSNLTTQRLPPAPLAPNGYEMADLGQISFHLPTSH